MEKKYMVYVSYKKVLINILMKQSNNKNFKQKQLKELVKYTSSNLSLNNLEDNSGKYSLFGADGYVKSIDFYEMNEKYVGIVKDGAGVGRITYNPEKTSILGTMGYLTAKENVNLKYVYYYLNTINLGKYVVGSTIPHIYYKDYSKEIIKLPNMKKQEQYVDLLDSINTIIEDLNKKIETNKNFKKTLLSKMFC